MDPVNKVIAAILDNEQLQGGACGVAPKTNFFGGLKGGAAEAAAATANGIAGGAITRSMSGGLTGGSTGLTGGLSGGSVPMTPAEILTKNIMALMGGSAEAAAPAAAQPINGGSAAVDATAATQAATQPISGGSSDLEAGAKKRRSPKRRSPKRRGAKRHLSPALKRSQKRVMTIYRELKRSKPNVPGNKLMTMAMKQMGRENRSKRR